MKTAALISLLLACHGCSTTDAPGSNAQDGGDASAPPADGGSTDGGPGTTDGGSLAQQGQPCGPTITCAPGLSCRTGIGPSQFTGTCEPYSKEGEPCVVSTPGGAFDCMCCTPGLVCDLVANRCKTK